MIKDYDNNHDNDDDNWIMTPSSSMLSTLIRSSTWSLSSWIRCLFVITISITIIMNVTIIVMIMMIMISRTWRSSWMTMQQVEGENTFHSLPHKNVQHLSHTRLKAGRVDWSKSGFAWAPCAVLPQVCHLFSKQCFILCSCHHFVFRQSIFINPFRLQATFGRNSLLS